MATGADRARATSAGDVLTIENRLDAIGRRRAALTVAPNRSALDAQITPRLQASVGLRLVDTRFADLPTNPWRAQPCHFAHENLRRAIVLPSILPHNRVAGILTVPGVKRT